MPLPSFSPSPLGSSGVLGAPWPGREGPIPGGLSPARAPQRRFVRIFQRVAFLSIIVSFYLKRSAHGANCVSLKRKDRCRISSPSYPWIIYRPVLHVPVWSSTVYHQVYRSLFNQFGSTHWLSTWHSLTGYSREQNWWKPCSHRAYGFEGCLGNYQYH